MTTNDDAAPVEVSVGPGVAPDALAYVATRFAALQRYAPRPITRITARVTKSHHRAAPELLEIGASLAVGDHLLRAKGVAAGLAAAVDLAYERLRCQLANLSHGRRGDFVPHRRAAR